MSVPLRLLVQMSIRQEVDARNLPPYESRAYLKTIEGILNDILFQKYSGHRLSLRLIMLENVYLQRTKETSGADSKIRSHVLDFLESFSKNVSNTRIASRKRYSSICVTVGVFPHRTMFSGLMIDYVAYTSTSFS